MPADKALSARSKRASLYLYFKSPRMIGILLCSRVWKMGLYWMWFFRSLMHSRGFSYQGWVPVSRKIASKSDGICFGFKPRICMP